MVVVSSSDRMNRSPRGLGAVGIAFLASGLIALFLLLLVAISRNRVGIRGDTDSVVLYCAQDQIFSEEILAEFSRKTGFKVRTVYDSEAVKTVGLANRLIAEIAHPRAHVFWGNEELRTRQLAARGVFGTNRIGSTDAGWVAFGARTRRLVVDSRNLPLSARPTSLLELTNARWKGKLSMAMPLFGTASTHLHLLRATWGESAWREWCRALMANRPFLEPGNSHVVRRVARGEALVGLTDSDDIAVARADGAQVEALALEDDFLTIPNTIGLVRPAPPESPARKLVEFLTSDSVRARLVATGALETATRPPGRWIQPEWDTVLKDLDVTVRELEGIFRR